MLLGAKGGKQWSPGDSPGSRMSKAPDVSEDGTRFLQSPCMWQELGSYWSAVKEKETLLPSTCMT